MKIEDLKHKLPFKIKKQQKWNNSFKIKLKVKSQVITNLIFKKPRKGNQESK